MRIYEPIAGIEGVATGAYATVKIPSNRRLHLIKFFANATDAVPAAVTGANVIDEILIYVKGRLQRNITATELHDLEALNGRVTAAADSVDVFMSEPWRASVMDEQVTAWDLWGAGDITIKVKIKAALTAITLSAVMVHDDGFTTNSQGQRVMNIVRHTPFNFNGGTTYDIMGLDIDKPIQRVYLYPAAGTSITSVKAVVNDSVTVHEMTAAQNVEFLKDYGLVYAPGNGVRYPLCFDLEQQVFNGLPPPRSLRITVVQSAAGSIKAVLENRATDYV